MDPRTIQILFALLRSAVCGTKLTESERESYSLEMAHDLLNISSRHDLSHLLAHGLNQNGFVLESDLGIDKYLLEAVYLCEQIKCEYELICLALEKSEIPFIPLKGSVIRKYYPEEWMRMSCDIDILVHREDLGDAVLYLTENHKYVEKGRSAHDISLYSPNGIHVELHYDLIEEGRANNAIDVLKYIWSNVSLHNDSKYRYEMSDPYFYFYHIAHIAKHFETGGCGIRPFLDLLILDRMDNVDQLARDNLLTQGGLLQFAETCRNLSQVWFGGREPEDILIQMQDFILHGGVYGTLDNYIVLQQTKCGGKWGYILSRVFVPFAICKVYYPILEKFPWLMPLMQIRRWFKLLNPDVAKRAKRELAMNRNFAKTKADEMNAFLGDIGLN